MRSEIVYAEINKMQNGDFSGYETFYAETAPYIYALICDVIEEADQAEQMLQQVFHEIYARIGEVTQMDEFQAWAYKIATDRICESSMREMEFRLTDDDTYTYQIADDEETQMVSVPEYIFRDMQGQKYIKDNLAGCTKLQKLLVQYCTEEVPLDEIAGKTGLNQQEIQKELTVVHHRLDQVLASIKRAEQEPVYQMHFIPFLGMVFHNLVAVSNGEAMAAVGLTAAGASVIAGGTYAGTASVAGTAQSAVAGFAGTSMAGASATGAAGVGASAAGVAGVGASAAGVAGMGASMAGAAGTSAVGAIGAGAVSAGTSMAGAVGAGAAAVTGAVTSAGAAGTAVAMGIGTKIAIGVASLALVAGGTVGVHHLVTKNQDKPTTVQVETATDAVAEDATPEDATEAVVEEIYTDPVVDGYYFIKTREKDIVKNLDYELNYLTYVGDEAALVKTAFETWQTEKINNFYPFQEDATNFLLPDGRIPTATGTIDYVRADSKILSVSYYDAQSLGGDREFDYTDYVNFDVATGNILTVNDLGEAKESLKAQTIQCIGEKYGDLLNSNWQETVETAFANNEVDFAMGYAGIEVDFNMGELGSNGMGPAHVTISYSDISGLNPDYLPEEDVTCLDIGYKNNYSNFAVYYDIDQDGRADEICFMNDGNEDFQAQLQYLTINGANIGEGFSSMRTLSGKLIRTVDGQLYIELEIRQDEGTYSDYIFYDLSSGTPVEVQRFTDVMEMHVDPYSVQRSSEINVFGNYTGTKPFRFSAEGLVSDYHYYTLSQGTDGLSLTAKQDVACKYEQDGHLVDGTIAAGTVIHPMQCDIDNHEFLFQLEDGTKGRILYDQDENGVSVNGVASAELF